MDNQDQVNNDLTLAAEFTRYRSAANKWEQILYRFFTHESLWYGAEWGREKSDDGTWTRFGKIFPSDETKAFLERICQGLQVESVTVVRELDAEIGERLASFGNAVERFQYIAGIKYKFADVIERIPLYRNILANMTIKIQEAGERVEFGHLLFTTMYFVEKLGLVNEVIMKYMNDCTRVFNDQEALKGGSPTMKLKWLCSDSVAAFVLTELINKGYIDEPITNGERSYRKTARICADLFQFATTSEEYLENLFNPERNRLSETKRGKFVIPEASQLK